MRRRLPLYEMLRFQEAVSMRSYEQEIAVTEASPRVTYTGELASSEEGRLGGASTPEGVRRMRRIGA